MFPVSFNSAQLNMLGQTLNSSLFEGKRYLSNPSDGSYEKRIPVAGNDQYMTKGEKTEEKK